MIILSSPSGAGKTTLSKFILENDANITLSVSVTTRPKRILEKEAVDYYFINQNQFDILRNNGHLLEYAIVHGNLYGTIKKEVESILDSGKDVLFDIDWQGAEQLRKQKPDNILSIFILPPSLESLENRLRKRARDSEKEIYARMEMAITEINHWQSYDYVVINEDLDICKKEIQSIITAERLKRKNNQDIIEKLLYARVARN